MCGIYYCVAQVIKCIFTDILKLNVEHFITQISNTLI